MSKIHLNGLMGKNKVDIATSSNEIENSKSNAIKKGNNVSFIKDAKKEQCVVLLKKLKNPNTLRQNGAERDMAGTIKLKKFVIKLPKLKGLHCNLEKKAAAALPSVSTVPQAKIVEKLTKKCVVRMKRMKNNEPLQLVSNNSSAIELPRSIASPLLPNDFGIQLGNLMNKSNTTQQNTNIEPICLNDSYMSTKSNTSPLNESVRENGHAISTNQSIIDDQSDQSPVHISNSANDTRSPQTPVSKTEESSENCPNASQVIADKNGKAKTFKLTTLQKQHKFFNRKKQISTKVENSKQKKGSFERKKLSRNVYDFFSQSSSSDQEKPADAAADIIKQMIIDGKVVVTTSNKGKLRCKPTQARAKKVRPVGKRKQCSLIDINKNIKNTETTENPQYLKADGPTPSSPSSIMSPVYEADDIGENIFEEEPIAAHITPMAKSNKSKARDSYINLARSVLINESSKNKRELDINKRQKLLDVARKFVSTPINKKLSNIRRNEALNNTNLSPIVGPTKSTPQLISCKSPWRVPDDVPLPNTFVFGLNSSHLPSFSSDFLLKSPRKQKSNKESYINQNQSAASTSTKRPRESESLLPPIDNQSISIIETFQQPLNNSNGENLPPKPDYSLKNISTKSDENNDYSDENQENDENFVHLPNPRCTIENRIPFKKINILDVITLPSWKNNDNKISTKEQRTNKTQDIVSDDAAKQSSTSNEKLFGFDEFLNNSSSNPSDSDDILQQSTSKNISNSNNNKSNKTLEEIYKHLEDIRPMEDEMLKPTKEPMRFGYDEGGARQKDLREMFCSTMINQNKTLTDGGISNQNQQNVDNEADDETNNLFNDPETTFNNKQAIQTYERPKKRARKKRHNFVMFMDSDLSDEDEEGEEDACHKKHKPKRKKHRSNKENAELKEFVTSFNEMCKDVESYELVVE